MRSVRGFSIVELLVALGLFMLVVFGSQTMLATMFSFSQFHAQKLEARAIKTQIMTLMRTAGNCSCQLNPALTVDDGNDPSLVFNSGVTPISLNLRRVKLGCAIDSPTLIQEGAVARSGLRISRVEFTNMRPTGTANEWQGVWRVNFENATIKPVDVHQIVLLDPVTLAADPTQATIGACQGASNDAGLIDSCPAGWHLMGAPATIGNYCIEINSRPARKFAEALIDCGNNRPANYGPAHLCDHGEWYPACLEVGFTAQNNWVMDWNDEYGVTAGGSGCSSWGWGYLPRTSPNRVGHDIPYRCCLR